MRRSWRQRAGLHKRAMEPDEEYPDPDHALEERAELREARMEREAEECSRSTSSTEESQSE